MYSNSEFCNAWAKGEPMQERVTPPPAAAQKKVATSWIDRIELLTYIATMSEELAILAARAGENFPAHHLTLASHQLLEAAVAERTRRPGASKRPPIDPSACG